MASIKLDKNKSYRVNFRLLEATQPATVRITVAENPGVNAPPDPGGVVTCTSKSVNYFWDFNYNLNTAPSSEPEQSPVRWVAIGGPSSVFSIRFPAANRWKQLFGVTRNPDTISIGFGGARAGYPAPPRVPIFISQCKGDFDTPLPGNSKQVCTSKADSGYGAATVILGPTAPNYNSPVYVKWSGDKDFYVNFRFDPAGLNATMGMFIDLFLSNSGGGLGIPETGTGGTGTGTGIVIDPVTGLVVTRPPTDDDLTNF